MLVLFKSTNSFITSHSILRLSLVFQLLFFLPTVFADPDQETGLTEQEQEWIKQHPKIIVGGSPDWKPFNFVNKKGQYSGIANDYLNLVSKKTGLQFEISIDKWSNNLQKIKTKEVDVLPAVYFTKERDQYLSFSSPYFEMLDYFFISDDLEVKILDDLNAKRVAIPKDYAHKELLEKHFPKIKIITVETFTQAIEAVLENRADMLYDTYASLAYTIKEEGINTIVPFKSTRHLGKNSIHIVTRKNDLILSSIIQKGLNQITEQEKNTIFEKWLGNRPQDKKSNIKLTEEERNWIAANPVIRYGAEKDWAPFDFVNDDGDHDGIAKDFLELIGNLSGLEFEPVIDDWNVLLKEARDNKIDLLPVIYFSEERTDYFFYSKPYQSMLDYFFIREDIKANSFEELNGKVVALPKDFLVYIELIKNKFPQLKILEVDNLMSAIESVIEGKADILFDSYSVVSYLLKKHKITTIKPFKALPPAEPRNIYMVTSKEKSMLIDIINKCLDSIPESDKQQLYIKWFGLKPDADVNKLILSRDEEQWLAEHPVIRFAGDPNWLPYEAFDKEGNYIGIVSEYLSLIEKKLGIEINIIQTDSWGESIEKVKQGQIDIISETNDSTLGEYLGFTDSYISSPIVIVMKNSEDYVETINSIKHKKIAVIKDYGYLPKIIKNYPDINFYEVDSIQDGLTSVSTGKVDVLLATLAQASYHISELGINNIRIVGKTKFNTKLAFGMREEFVPLITMFNKALNDISQSEKQRIFDNWGKNKYAERIDYALLFKVALVFLFILVIFVYWNRKLAVEVKRRKEAENQVQALIDNVPLPIIVTTLNGDILTANPRALNDYEVNQEELGSYNMSDFYHDLNDRKELLKELNEKGKVEQKIIQFKKVDGGLHSLMVSVMPVFYLNKKALLNISVDMTERMEMEKALKTAKENAESASRAKSDFLANMSHEIRTPMNAIIGFTELLNEQVKEPKLKSFVKTIQSAGQNLLVLINDILDLSKIEAGKMKIEKKACNPHDLFHDLGNVFMLKMQEKNIDFVLDVDPAIPSSLILDEIRLRQILLNLIGNSVKFTDKGFIRLRARTTNEDEIKSKLDLLIDVEDSGIGISEEHKHLIFHEFEQVKGQDLGKYGGTGLGLSICKRLLDMMGGEISLESEVGRGSTFTIKLNDVSVSSLIPEKENVKESLSGNVSFKPAKVLIVDDVVDNRDMLAAIFAETNIEVIEAKNGLDAVYQAEKNNFDLIIMDIRMPVMDGYTAAEKIKSFAEVPIVALTASVMTDDFERKKSDKFDGYLRKPVLKKDLISELCKFLSYEEKAVEEKDSQIKNLTESDRKNVPQALQSMIELISQCEKVSNNNNISEIKDFAEAVLEINKQHPVSIINDYVEDLMNSVHSYDIAAIKQYLVYFPELIKLLEDNQ
jgi:two-component system sensor histidine kinase EvgS